MITQWSGIDFKKTLILAQMWSSAFNRKTGRMLIRGSKDATTTVHINNSKFKTIANC